MRLPLPGRSSAARRGLVEEELAVLLASTQESARQVAAVLIDADGARRTSMGRSLLELVEHLHGMAAELPGKRIVRRRRDPDAD